MKRKRIGTKLKPPLDSEILRELSLKSLMLAMALPRQECTVERYIQKQKHLLLQMEDELWRLKLWRLKEEREGGKGQ